MGSCMTKNSKSLLVLSCQNVQFAVAVKNCTEVYNLSVYFSCTCCACQSFADVISDVNYWILLRNILFWIRLSV